MLGADEVNVTVRLVNEATTAATRVATKEEKAEAVAEAYHDVHDEDGDHEADPGHRPCPPDGDDTDQEIEWVRRCLSDFGARPPADVGVTVRRPQRDDHDKHRDHSTGPHARSGRGCGGGAIGLALIFLGCWFVRNYTQRAQSRWARALPNRDETGPRDRVPVSAAPFSVLPGAAGRSAAETHETLLQRRAGHP